MSHGCRRRIRWRFWGLGSRASGVLTSWFLPPPRRAWEAVQQRERRAQLKLQSLLRVQLDDELLFDRCGDLAPLRLPQHLRGERVVIRLQPGGDLAGQL